LARARVCYTGSMFGYIAPLKSELKVREFEAYGAYYCAVCRAVKRRYGELPRLLLSYDSAFLALLGASLSGGEPAFVPFRCFANPARGRRAAAPSAAVDYAADMLVLLGYLSLKDRRADEGGAGAACAEAALRRAGRRAAAAWPAQAEQVFVHLAEIAALERARCERIDRVADPFGRLMAEVLDLPFLPAPPAAPDAPTTSALLRRLGYHLGRFIYILDALDDREKDRKSGAYNPLLAAERSAVSEPGAPNLADASAPDVPAQASASAPNTLELALQLDLAGMADALGQLPLGAFRGILENIVYLGLNQMKDDVLAGRRTKRRYLRP